jgi:hypothetical protein
VCVRQYVERYLPNSDAKLFTGCHQKNIEVTELVWRHANGGDDLCFTTQSEDVEPLIANDIHVLRMECWAQFLMHHL